MKTSTLIMVLLLATVAVAVTAPQSPFRLTGTSAATEGSSSTYTTTAPAKNCPSGTRYASYYRQCVRVSPAAANE
jgi:hypothetical protein